MAIESYEKPISHESEQGSSREPAATHVRCNRVCLQETSHADGVFLLLVDSQVHRFHASQEQPRVERAETGALRVLEEVDLNRLQIIETNGEDICREDNTRT